MGNYTKQCPKCIQNLERLTYYCNNPACCNFRNCNSGSVIFKEIPIEFPNEKNDIFKTNENLRKEKWDKRHLSLAKFYSQYSKDPSTQCGAVIADGIYPVGLGYNGFPPGIDDKDEHYEDRETKYNMINHAEMNAIKNSRVPVDGFAIYIYPLPPCEICTRMIITWGIRRVITVKPSKELLERWGAKIKLSEGMLEKVGISIEYVDQED